MAESMSERDWKYMKKIKADLLASLCERINKKSIAILQEKAGSEYERYLKHYKNVQDSDRIIAECFNDWRRSTLLMKLATLQRHALISQEQLEQLSEDSQRKLAALREL